jgi:argininosuccinate synthase
MDANLLHISYEGDILEDPWAEPEDDMINSSLRCAASLSKVKLSMARCAFSITVPAGVS